MDDIFRCGNTDEHFFHTILVEREFQCSGMTSCGEKLHEPHYFKKEVEEWCGGICKCNFRQGTHGPGAHK